jgi:hypothetical protein
VRGNLHGFSLGKVGAPPPPPRPPPPPPPGGGGAPPPPLHGFSLGKVPLTRAFGATSPRVRGEVKDTSPGSIFK